MKMVNIRGIFANKRPDYNCPRCSSIVTITLSIGNVEMNIVNSIYLVETANLICTECLLLFSVARHGKLLA